jgi:hypothetical protein
MQRERVVPTLFLHIAFRTDGHTQTTTKSNHSSDTNTNTSELSTELNCVETVERGKRGKGRGEMMQVLA